MNDPKDYKEIRESRRNISALKKKIWLRDNYTCHYCGLNMKPLWDQWKAGRIKRKHVLVTVDHIIPKSKGGTWDESNLLTACKHCNVLKSDKPYETSKPISHRSKSFISSLLEMLGLR